MKKMSLSLDKTYDPNAIEQPIYEYWEKQGYFKPGNRTDQESFCIMIPPPNVTGSLHMGHAFQQTIMDILIRYHRMQGKNTLWQVGTDHAGIATQMVVEHKIAGEEAKTRHDYGREAFIQKIWDWKAESGGNITRQMRRLGNSVDWERERFTMDENLSLAVKEAFVRLYQEDLIYRGKRLVNWDPKLRTAISDLEVENREYKGSMWYLRYPLADNIKTTEGKNYLVVATTRPETMPGDTGIAVNPSDPRYKNLIGKKVLLPLVNRIIPIVGDEYADQDKGTGCVKITPAHDFNDYKVGKRHELPMINILTFEGHIRHHPEVFDNQGHRISMDSAIIPEFLKGMERFAARKAVVAAFKKSGLLEEIKPHDLTVPYGDRSQVVIEPMLTDQWYVRAVPLAKAAIEAVEKGDIQFVPKQYENMYYSWMRNIQDWCISRQLWWGHRIPAWYDEQGKLYVGRDEKEVRREHHLPDDLLLRQDEDVLDTWFSSALWTFSTLGWPDKTEALQVFHPTSVLVSGFDIIFFWIARMIMLTLHFVKDKNSTPQIPFKTVYMTGLIRDEEGQKMSKSKGNVIDPLDMIDGISLRELLKKRTDCMMQPQLAEKICQRTQKQFPNGIEPHGTDALRFTLTALASTGRDINWDMKRLTGYRNFCNKLWNASRFVLLNTSEQDCGQNGGDFTLSLADRWIISTFQHSIQSYRDALDQYRFDVAAEILYEFTWNQFCDWYLELSKPILNQDAQTPETQAQSRETRHTLLAVLEALLRLAHPMIPYITEVLWQEVKKIQTLCEIDHTQSIMVQPFPEYDVSQIDEQAFSHLEWIKKMTMAIRNVRAEMNIPLNKKIEIEVVTTSQSVQKTLLANQDLIKSIARLSSITVLDKAEKAPSSVVTRLMEDAEIRITLLGLFDKATEQGRLKNDIIRIEKEIELLEKKLANVHFTERAPKSIVSKERDRLAQLMDTRQKLFERSQAYE